MQNGTKAASPSSWLYWEECTGGQDEDAGTGLLSKHLQLCPSPLSLHTWGKMAPGRKAPAPGYSGAQWLPLRGKIWVPMHKGRDGRQEGPRGW